MSEKIWSKLHQRYQREDWIQKPTIFARTVLRYFPASGSIVDLGAGQGQDTRYFAANGFHVTSTDLSEDALAVSKRHTLPELANRITFQKFDLRDPFPFDDASFDVVYAHLSLHYFDTKQTSLIFDEIHRVLHHNGILAFLVNSIDDPEYQADKEIEPGVLILNGLKKRFFSVDTIRPYLSSFSIVLLNRSGETYKDRRKGVHNLIQCVARKASP